MKKDIGFTNKLAISLVILLFAGLLGGFILALLSIGSQYNGALYCWTIVFTPLGAAIPVVLSKVVNKNKEENTDENGKGISYAIAEAQNFYQNLDDYTTNATIGNVVETQNDESEIGEDNTDVPSI